MVLKGELVEAGFGDGRALVLAKIILALQCLALTPIADPSVATAEDCANKINEILAALQSSSL